MDLVTRPQLDVSRPVSVIAHRGNSKIAPENTLPSFTSAIESGAKLVELDYFHSLDGVPVVFHDKTLDRTTNARQVLGRRGMSVSQATLAQLRQLDAGSWFNERFANTPIPTLEEALDVIQPGATTVIEHKSGDAATCVELLKRKGMLRDVVVQSFDWEFIAECRRIAPDLELAALGDAELNESKLDEIQKSGAQIVGWNQKHVGAKQIAAIHARGLKAWVYTVNDSARASELIDAGIDGLITDVPRQILDLLGEN